MAMCELVDVPECFRVNVAGCPDCTRVDESVTLCEYHEPVVTPVYRLLGPILAIERAKIHEAFRNNR